MPLLRSSIIFPEQSGYQYYAPIGAKILCPPLNGDRFLILTPNLSQCVTDLANGHFGFDTREDSR